MVNREFIQLVENIFHDHEIVINTYGTIGLKKNDFLIRIHNYNDIDYNNTEIYFETESIWYINIYSGELLITKGYEEFILTDFRDTQLPIIYKKNEYELKIGSYINSMKNNNEEYVITSFRESSIRKLENEIRDKD